MPLVIVMLLALWTAGAIHAQITNPIPAPVEKRGLMVEIRDVVRLPDTRGMRPADQDVTPAGWARVSFVRDLPDGRRFANDSRGFLYLLDRNNQPSVYANVAAAFPFAVYNRLESGFIGFDFHPEFARNGLFYTVHGERATGQSRDAQLHPARVHAGGRDLPQRHHRVARDEPGGQHVRGHEARAAPRGAHRRQPHAPVRRTSSSTRRRSPATPDYGLLYTSGSDLGFSNGGGPHANNPGQTQRLDSVITRHPAHRSAQSVGDERDEGTRGLHDSAGQQVRRGRRSEDARRDLRLRLPQRPPAVVGSHRRDDVRVRHRDEPHRGDQHRPQRRELRLDEAGGVLGERHDAARRRAQPVVPAAGGRAGRARRRTASPIRSRSTTTTKDRR